jgi:enoyl-CoA hydratase
MYKHLITSFEEGVLVATINRPDKLNALNRDVFTDLETLLAEVESNDSIRVVVITGAGNKAFVAGADISEFLGLIGEEGMDLAKRGQHVFLRIENSSKPFIAAVNGFALGGGCELAMACHFRLASDQAKFGQPEVNLGLIPGYGGTQRLAQLIGKGRAMELLMTGNMIDAVTALQFGLVNHVVPPQELLSQTIDIGKLISQKAPLAIEKCIKAVNALFDHNEDGFEVEVQAFGDCFESEDMKERTAAFLEKRNPVFKGK